MVSAIIPFKKLNNKVFKEFLFKYIKKPIPDESTIRKNYLDVCYKTTIEKIRKEIGNSIIYTTGQKFPDTIINLKFGALVGEVGF